VKSPDRRGINFNIIQPIEHPRALSAPGHPTGSWGKEKEDIGHENLLSNPKLRSLPEINVLKSACTSSLLPSLNNVISTAG
jgi:hypothetical protein